MSQGGNEIARKGRKDDVNPEMKTEKNEADTNKS